MNTSTHVGTSMVAKRPKSLFRRQVKFDLKPLFTGLSKAALHSFTLSFDELGSDVAEIVSGLSLNTADSELAFLLIKRAIFNACHDLAKESLSHFQPTAELTNALSSSLETDLDNLKISIDRNFLDKPAEQKFLGEIQKLYSQWLADMGANPRSAETLSKRLPSYFVFALTAEWRKNYAAYKPLAEAINSPFGRAEERERDWKNYFSALSRRTQENVFDEPFSLAQIYIPLRASYTEHNKAQQKADGLFHERQKEVVVDLAVELTGWLKSADREDAVRVISGGPGSGKSSFTRMFCASVADSGLAKPIYIPLHLIDPTREIADEVYRFTRDEGFLRFNPFESDHQESSLLLIFDGLDELASQGKAAAQVAKDFVQAVERMVERRNLGPYPIYVIISGRELVIQENSTEFRRPKQVLSVLPYYVPKHDRSSFVDPKKLLDTDHRNKWWAKYGQLSGLQFDRLPRELQLPGLDEITSQPLLNYLVALSYTRGKLDFGKTQSLNSIYADLVAAVYERGYEKGRTYKPICHISLKDFIRVMEEIGLAAWHASDGRSTSVKEILTHCNESGLESLMKTFQEGAQAGVTKLLAAFFFRKNGVQTSGDATFVFTHKSFGEYLTAARIVRGIERIVTQLERRRQNPDDGIDTADALVQWAKLVGPAQITPYIHNFLGEGISSKSAEVELWQDHLSTLMSYIMSKGMPMEKAGSLSFQTMLTHNNNACATLLICLNACAVTTKQIIKLSFPTRTSFGTLFKQLCGQRPGSQSPILYQALSYFDLSGQCLDMVDFYDANLECSLLVNCYMHYATLSRANLRGTDLSGSVLWNAWLDGAHLNHAKLENARVENVDFERADLSFANLKGANFDGCKFFDTVFNKQTDISGATFHEMDLSGITSDSHIDFSVCKIESRPKRAPGRSRNATHAVKDSDELQGKLDPLLLS